LKRLASIFAEAGYTEEEYAIDRALINGAYECDPWSFSCDGSVTTEGNHYTLTLHDVVLTAIEVESIAVMPHFMAAVPVESGLKYMPQPLIDNMQLHNADEAENRDYWYIEYAAGTCPDNLLVYSQTDGQYVWECEIVSCSMAVRAEVPADLTTVSMLDGAYAGIWLIPDENGEIRGDLVLRYNFYYAK